MTDIVNLDERREQKALEIATYQRQKIRDLESEKRMRAAEERRLSRLLGLALRVATRDGGECDPLQLLELLCALDGTDPARPAWVEESERAASLQELRDEDVRFWAAWNQVAA